MATIKSFALLALAALVERAVSVPQGAATITPSPVGIALGTGQALPDLNGPGTTSGGCDVCHIVADVAAYIWYSEVFINTAATEVVSVLTGNGTTATRTFVSQNQAPFTFDPERMSSAFSSNLALTAVNYNSTVTIGGAVLSSPTAYNVYSAYSITSANYVNGQCVTTSGPPVTVDTPYSQILSSASGRVTVDQEGEEAFIRFLGFTTCSGGGGTASPVALVPVANLTTTTTRTGNSVSLASPSKSLAPTTNPTISAVPAGIITLTEVMSSTTVTAVLTGTAIPSASGTAPVIVIGSTTITPSASATAPVIVIGSTTITPSAAPFGLPGIEPSQFSALTPNETIVAPSGTVTGTGIGNYSVVPFVNGAAKISGYSTTIWGSALAAMVVVVGLL